MQLSKISMTPLKYLLWSSAINQALLTHRQTLIYEWIGQLPAVLNDYPLSIDILFWYSTSSQKKVKKYWATYPCTTRGTGTPVKLLKQYITTTGRAPRNLRIDTAEKSTSQEMVDFCRENNIILQPVVAQPHHAMQAHVEGAIGCSK